MRSRVSANNSKAIYRVFGNTQVRWPAGRWAGTTDTRAKAASRLSYITGLVSCVGSERTSRFRSFESVGGSLEHFRWCTESLRTWQRRQADSWTNIVSAPSGKKYNSRKLRAFQRQTMVTGLFRNVAAGSRCHYQTTARSACSVSSHFRDASDYRADNP